MNLGEVFDVLIEIRGAYSFSIFQLYYTQYTATVVLTHLSS